MDTSEEVQGRGPQTRSQIVTPLQQPTSRRRVRRHSSDVILVDSNPADLPPAQRRLRLIDDFNPNSAIIDLTCADEVVDLTVPSPEVNVIEDAPVEINDDDALHSTISDHDSSHEGNQQPTLYCPVCLEKYSKIVKSGVQLKSTICGHVFCATCISTAIFHSKKCPTCRKKLDSKKVHNLYLPL